MMNSMNRSSKSDEPRASAPGNSRTFRANRIAERARAVEPSRVDQPTRADWSTRHREPARWE
jgi:hypothetical protein